MLTNCRRDSTSQLMPRTMAHSMDSWSSVTRVYWRRSGKVPGAVSYCSACASSVARKRSASKAMRSSAAVRGAEGGQAFLRRFYFGVTAAFLLDQVVFDAAAVFGRRKKLLPRRHPFAEQNRIALGGVGRPFFAMHGTDTAGIGLDPGDWIGADFQAGADVELQHDGRFGVFGKYVHRPSAAVRERLPFGLMIVVADTEALGRKLVGSGVQRVCDLLPGVCGGSFVRAGHDHVLATEDEVEFAGVADLLRRKETAVIVGREAADAEIVEKLAHVLGLCGSPVVVGGVELQALVAGRGHGAHRTLQVLSHGLPDGIHLEPDRNLGGGARRRCEWQASARSGSEGSSDKFAARGQVRAHAVAGGTVEGFHGGHTNAAELRSKTGKTILAEGRRVRFPGLRQAIHFFAAGGGGCCSLLGGTMPFMRRY